MSPGCDASLWKSWEGQDLVRGSWESPETAQSGGLWGYWTAQTRAAGAGDCGHPCPRCPQAVPTFLMLTFPSRVTRGVR